MQRFAEVLDGLGALLFVLVGFLVLGLLYGLVQVVPFVVIAAFQGSFWAQVAVAVTAWGLFRVVRSRS